MKQGSTPETISDPITAALLLTLCLGVAVGSILNAFVPAPDICHNPLLRQGMGTDMAAYSAGRSLLELCGIPLFWLFCTGIAGTSVVGKPLAFGLLLWRGTALGAVLCDIYMLQGIAGFLTAILFAVPCALTGTFLFLISTREAIRFSSALFRHTLNGSEELPPLRLYMLRFLVTAVFLTLSGGVQCIWLKTAYPVYLEWMAG